MLLFVNVYPVTKVSVNPVTSKEPFCLLRVKVLFEKVPPVTKLSVNPVMNGGRLRYVVALIAPATVNPVKNKLLIVTGNGGKPWFLVIVKVLPLVNVYPVTNVSGAPVIKPGIFK